MKAIPQFLTSLLTLTCLFLASSVMAQNTWKGGIPGAETDWNNPRNWSEGRLPDWSDDLVIIPNVRSQSGYFPIVKTPVPDIACLSIEGGAKITILSSGHLTINGESTFNYGILNTGEVFNSGYLTILETALSPLANHAENIYNNGIFVMDDLNKNEPLPVAMHGN